MQASNDSSCKVKKAEHIKADNADVVMLIHTCQILLGPPSTEQQIKITSRVLSNKIHIGFNDFSGSGCFKGMLSLQVKDNSQQCQMIQGRLHMCSVNS